MSGIVQQLITIWSFEAATQTWLVYDPLAPAQANTLSYLMERRTYWIAVTVDTTLIFEARTRTIYKGWNLIGW